MLRQQGGLHPLCHPRCIPLLLRLLYLLLLRFLLLLLPGLPLQLARRQLERRLQPGTHLLPDAVICCNGWGRRSRRCSCLCPGPGRGSRAARATQFVPRTCRHLHLLLLLLLPPLLELL